MSWLKPHADEPTHKEFVLAWQNPLNKTIRQVSAALIRQGYVCMTPRKCWRWYKRFIANGVNLRRRRRPPQEKEQVAENTSLIDPGYVELTDEQVVAANKLIALRSNYRWN